MSGDQNTDEEGVQNIEEEDPTIGLLCLDELAKQVLQRRTLKEVSENESSMVAAVLISLVCSAPPPTRKYSATELLPLVRDTKEDVALIVEVSKQKLEDYLLSLSTQQIKKRSASKLKYRVDQSLWEFSELKDIGLSNQSLSILSDEIHIGKPSKELSIRESKTGPASPPKEKRIREEEPTSPKKRLQPEKVRTPQSNKKDKKQGGISGMKSMLSRFVVKKKIEPKAGEERFWWPYAIKSDAAYCVQDMDFITNKRNDDDDDDDDDDDGKESDYRFQLDHGKVKTIKLTTPNLSLASQDDELNFTDLLTSITTSINEHSVNMFHPLVTRGGPPVELIACRDLINEGVQFVGSATDPTTKMAAVWSLNKEMPRDDDEIDYEETYSDMGDDESCSGSSIGNEEESLAESASGDSDLIESESDVDEEGQFSSHISTNAITISGPARSTPVKSIVSIADESTERLVPSFCNTALSKIIKLPIHDYGFFTYADWMSNHCKRCSAIPDHISMSEPVFFETPETVHSSGLKELTKQRGVWDTTSTSEFVKIVQYSSYNAPYLIESFRERFPSFTKSAVNNKLREISHRENKCWIVRPHLINHLGLTDELKDRKPLEPEPTTIKRQKKETKRISGKKAPRSKVSTRSQSILARAEKRAAGKKKETESSSSSSTSSSSESDSS